MKSKPKLQIVIAAALLSVLSPGALSAQEVRNQFKPEQKYYGIGSWNADSLGNHRVVLKVESKSEAVLAHIPWRRRDVRPEQKNVIIIDAATGAWYSLDQSNVDTILEKQQLL